MFPTQTINLQRADGAQTACREYFALLHVLKEFKQCIKQDLRGLYAQLNDRLAVFICSLAITRQLRGFGHCKSLNKDGAMFLIIDSP